MAQPREFFESSKQFCALAPAAYFKSLGPRGQENTTIVSIPSLLSTITLVTTSTRFPKNFIVPISPNSTLILDEKILTMKKMTQSSSSSTNNPNNLYIETDKLFVGTIVCLLNGDYHTITLGDKSKFFPRADANGFILHKSRISTDKEIGQKIYDLRKHYDNVFYPRHYNSCGVDCWYNGGDHKFPFSMFNYLLKCNKRTILPQNFVIRRFFEFIDYEFSTEDQIQRRLDSCTVNTDTCYSSSNGSYELPYITNLLVTSDPNIFDDISNFDVKDSERIVYIFNKDNKLVGVVCKILKTDDAESIGYIVGDQTAFMVTEENDVLFVNYHHYYAEALGEDAELDYGDFIGPVRKPRDGEEEFGGDSS